MILYRKKSSSCIELNSINILKWNIILHQKKRIFFTFSFFNIWLYEIRLVNNSILFFLVWLCWFKLVEKLLKNSWHFWEKICHQHWKHLLMKGQSFSFQKNISNYFSIYLLFAQAFACRWFSGGTVNGAEWWDFKNGKRWSLKKKMWNWRR